MRLTVCNICAHVVGTGVGAGLSCCGLLAVWSTFLGGRPSPISSPTQQAGWGFVVDVPGLPVILPHHIRLCHLRTVWHGQFVGLASRWCRPEINRGQVHCLMVLQIEPSWSQSIYRWPQLLVFGLWGYLRSMWGAFPGCRSGVACGLEANGWPYQMNLQNPWQGCQSVSP